MRKIQMVTVQYTEKEKRERKYECTHCKKRFTRPSSLTSHVYTHTGEKPFACDFPNCTKRFSVLSNLRRHYKVHTHKRQYGGRMRSATTASIIGGACNMSVHGMSQSAVGRTPFSGFTGRNRFNTLVSDDRSSYLPPLAAANTTAGFSDQRVYGYAPSFRTTAGLAQSVSALSQQQQQETGAMGSFGPSSLMYSANSTTQFPAAIFPSLDSSISSPNAAAAAAGSAMASLTNANMPPSSPSSNRSGSSKSTLGGFDPASPGSLGITFPAQLTTASMWPLSIAIPQNMSGLQTSANSAPIDMTSTAAAASLCALNSSSAAIDRALSNIFSRSPKIATPAIITNSSVTTKAMHGGIETSSSDPFALLDIPKQQQPQQPQQQQPPQQMAPSANILTGMSSIGGMVQSTNTSSADSLLDSLNSNAACLSQPSGGTAKISDPMWQLLQASSSLYSTN
ncbi:hypothetical protein EC988_002494 [Linderina pennispora]|nr:hypothetical protein EC988_002494 [Linderina pennispora]